MRPPRVGDVIEIPTSKGLAYAQITQKVPKYGPLIHVVEGFWRERPGDLTQIVQAPTRFFTFYPVGTALNRKVVQLAGNIPVPSNRQPFPLLRAAGHILPRSGKVVNWWLWDGNRKWRIPSLPEEQRRLSIAEVVNHTMLVHWLETGWHPDQEF
ncbi:MAG TPA: hypothetical protein VE965_07385 [Gammaproteobacteria bacterium]|jgi:hypothetical protein|nr:hypothetical protein [Gammaproteobacteria bacterium]